MSPLGQVQYPVKVNAEPENKRYDRSNDNVEGSIRVTASLATEPGKKRYYRSNDDLTISAKVEDVASFSAQDTADVSTESAKEPELYKSANRFFGDLKSTGMSLLGKFRSNISGKSQEVQSQLNKQNINEVFQDKLAKFRDQGNNAKAKQIAWGAASAVGTYNVIRWLYDKFSGTHYLKTKGLKKDARNLHKAMIKMHEVAIKSGASPAVMVVNVNPLSMLNNTKSASVITKENISIRDPNTPVPSMVNSIVSLKEIKTGPSSVTEEKKLTDHVQNTTVLGKPTNTSSTYPINLSQRSTRSKRPVVSLFGRRYVQYP